MHVLGGYMYSRGVAGVGMTSPHVSVKRDIHAPSSGNTIVSKVMPDRSKPCSRERNIRRQNNGLFDPFSKDIMLTHSARPQQQWRVKGGSTEPRIASRFSSDTLK